MTRSIQTIIISQIDANKILTLQESHFLDFKSRKIEPKKLSKSLSAFANADGGELYVGIDEDKTKNTFIWDGFEKIEDMNDIISVTDSIFQLSNESNCEILTIDQQSFILKIYVQKSREIKKTTDGKIYIRRSGSSLPIEPGSEQHENLKKSKGITSQEDQTINTSLDLVAESEIMSIFIKNISPQTQPLQFLNRQALVNMEKPLVAGLLLFADEPQAHMPKSGIKIYRYRTSDTEGSRSELDAQPLTIEGSIYEMISKSVSKTIEIVETIKGFTKNNEEFTAIKYPKETLHEIITNAVLHRDYSIHDDIHIKIFDNRIEVQSPGKLPAHITIKNILNERFARNPKIVRLINKFPNPPNKDIGEGLNTAFNEMKKINLREPEIVENENNVLVIIRHENLSSHSMLIIEYLKTNSTINNSQARELTSIDSEKAVLNLFKKLIRAGEIEKVPGTKKSSTKYQLVETKKPN